MLRKEKCTGDPARRLGNDLAFGQLAESNLETLRAEQGEEDRFHLPALRANHRHGLERIRRGPAHRASQRISGAASGPVARAHRRRAKRSCITIRAIWAATADVYDAPRDVVAKFGALTDPPRSRERSFCCGAGGGLAFLGEEKGKRISVERAEELVATGASVVAAACPFCNTMFRDALAGVSSTPPKLLDIAQIAAASFRAERDE